LVSVLGDISAIPLAVRGFGMLALSLSLSCAIFAIGLGVGSAFSPTTRRSTALLGVGLGALAYLVAIALGSMI
jgi:hypothetical protein